MTKASGQLITNGVNLLPDELETITVLLNYHHHIELIPLSRRTGVKTADMTMLGLH
ncbi:hypothetical protein IJJ12_01480 [bacterium]|nr:hypothetical protein [bacterium]